MKVTIKNNHNTIDRHMCQQKTDKKKMMHQRTSKIMT